MMTTEQMAEAIKNQRRIKVARMLVRRLFAQMANQRRDGAKWRQA